ncbi:MAG: hypothetical protein ACXW4C_09570 [Nitrospira sp.]
MVITSEDIASPPVMNTICSSRDLGARAPSLSSKEEAFLRDRYSTNLEDPQTGRWILSWRTEG